MDFSLTDEQVLLRESVGKYIQDAGGVERHRKLAVTEIGFDPAAWATFAELGWLALPFSEEQGGLGGSVTDLMVLSEALGRGLVREPYLHTAVTCGGLLAAFASEEQKQLYLPPLINGEAQWAFAFAEQSGGYAWDKITTSAGGELASLFLNGAKITALNAQIADHFLVTAMVDHELALLLVDGDSPGITRTCFTAVDGSKGAHLEFDAVAATLVCKLTVNELESALAPALIAIGGESLGAMQVLLEATVEYCKTREQFGQPIGKFQALQHRMADMYLKIEETRSLLYYAAILTDEGDDQAAAARAGMKVKLAEAGRFISHEAVQLHGGIGMTDELIVGHLFKRLLLLSKLFGDGDYHMERYLAQRAA
ncbi:acyl-CoA dehydrogenase family protein [Halioglobus maricola]|uniref:acyl-CoA dehydrogenase family protein n=1 Tax=Halioglobus maricola TaxID=2601894 RepID=UPI001478AC1E|nr:acyl-CoA dehydrogenase family protein [Halioglobus maricola]